MRNSFARAALCTLLVLGATAFSWGYLRLINPSTGAALWWGAPSAVSVVIHTTGSDDIDDGSHIPALRNAIDAWNDVEGTSAQLVENTNPASMAAGNWASTAHHVLRFDESNASGYFPLGSSTVALTPVWFYGNGVISDADVLFNGKGYRFTTSGEFGHFDVQDVATHELGHLLGLDHSGQAGSSLYPYVDSQVILHRSLSRDEEQALRAIYPDSAQGSLSGSVQRVSNSAGVPGAQIIARDAEGRTCGGTLTDGLGNFVIGGMQAGDYTLVALPLDSPVASGNISAGHVVVTDFEPRTTGPFHVNAGQAVGVGGLFVDADVALNLGTSGNRLPLRATRGVWSTHRLSGSALAPGSTLTASDPNVIVQVTGWSWAQVGFQLFVPAGEEIGHFDLIATNAAGEVSVLPAAVEITPPNPVVSAVSPSQEAKQGGVLLTVFGSNFHPGCRIVLAGQIYEESVAGGCTLVDANTLTLTTRPSPAGTWDVVVIDSSGVEGRLAGGHQFTTLPQVSTVFPVAGDDGGGTLLTIKGQEFVEGMTVTIDGVVQSTLAVIDPQTIQLLTEGGTAGGPYELHIQNPGGGVATANFAYVTPPDPDVIAVDPGGGHAAGGELVRIEGSHFAADTRIVFGADPETGLGGFEAPSVEFVNSTELTVQTPAFGFNGTLSVLASTASTGQASVISAAFTTSGAESGGGGGCYTVPFSGPPRSGDVLRSIAFFLLLAFGVRSIGPRRRVRPIAA